MARATARRALRFARPYRSRLAIYVGLLLVSAIGTASVPLITGQLINHGAARGRPDVVVALGALAVMAGLVSTAAASLGGWLGSTIGLGVTYDLRVTLYRHLQRLPLAFFMRSQSGAVQSRVNNDVIDAQALVQTVFGNLASQVVSLVVAVAAMWALSPLITAVSMVGAPLLLLPARRLGPTLRSFGRQQAMENARMNALLSERFNVQGAMLFSLAGRPDQDLDVFANKAADLRSAVMGRNATYRKAAFFFGSLATLAYGAVYLLGGWQAARGNLSVGTLVALAGLVAVAYEPLQAFAQGGVNVGPGLVAFERVFEVLDFPPAVAGPARPLPLPKPVSGVEFEQVSFRHPTATQATLASLMAPEATSRDHAGWALTDVSFQARAGTMTALVGPSGVGKTTVTLLVPRFYDPQVGKVRVSGVDVRELELPELRREVGMVTQDTYLLNDTLAANLRLFKPEASAGEVLDALERACLGALLMLLPDGMGTMVGDRGYRLSGGEKQRVALARVFLAQPSVVVLDEATAHLDSQTEAAVQAALEVEGAGRTLIVVAHRLSTVRKADQILVLDKGSIIEQGRHADLLAHGIMYPALYRADFEQPRPGKTSTHGRRR
ncbi:MAG TPA: ABC transporter ATP-binding protein [Acidimicrobiales bacterium]|nr:ABC transporter ATP-binding protein [Acidimicrobiales bacterium]